MILKERINGLAGKLRVLSQLAILPTCQTFTGSNPKTSIARGEEAFNKIAGEMLARRRLPGDTPHAIKTKQTEFRAHPQIAVGRLSYGVDHAFGKAFADLPRGVRVLADVERRV
jgi:hypothetical protein